MTLKVLVILHHFSQYFELTNTTMRDTNVEYVETLQSSLHIHEENHGYKVVRNWEHLLIYRKPKGPWCPSTAKGPDFHQLKTSP